MEGSPGAHRRTAREGHTKRPCGRVDVWGSEPPARMTETTPMCVAANSLTGRRLKLLQIRQNQVPATHCTSYSYHLRSFPQLLVQLRRRIAAIKARNPRHPKKQTQHHTSRLLDEYFFLVLLLDVVVDLDLERHRGPPLEEGLSNHNGSAIFTGRKTNLEPETQSNAYLLSSKG